MKAIRKLKMMLLLILMGSVGSLMAQTYPSWNKEKKGEFTIDRDYTLTSAITLTGNLTLHVGDGGGQGFTIKKNFEGDLFNVSGTSSSKIYKLTIIGNETDTVYIDGGAVYNTPGDARSGRVSGKRGRGFDIGDYGALELRYVAVQNFYNTTATEGAGIYGNNTTSTRTDMILHNCTFRGNLARYHASVLHYNDAARFQAHMKECRVYHNYSTMDTGEGGTIRCEGGAKSIMEIDSCDICYNRTKWSGGGISWYGGGTQDAKLLVTHNTKVHHNVAEMNGGGVYLGSTAQLVSAEIYNNEAYGYGGGVDMHTYGGPERNYGGKGLRVTIDENVSIHDNISRKGGGGMWVHLYPSRFLGFNSNDNAINVDSTKNIIKVIEGAQIYGNHAPFGGAIYVLDELPFRFQNPVSENWSKEYKREVTISGGDIYGNFAETIEGSTVTDCFGGAIYVHKAPLSGVSYSTSNSGARGAGTLNVYITGGNISGNCAKSDLQNGYGGGVCINDAFTKYNSYCNVLIGGSAEVYNNQADRDGGGMHIMSAKTSGNGVLSVKVDGGTIGKVGQPNKAIGGNGGGISVVGGNLLVDGGIIDYNEANVNNDNGGNGGAFSVVGGCAVISGGSVSYNKAELNGGGFYLDYENGPNDTINDGADISFNEAVNGGGVYVGNGSLVVKDAATNIKSNTASTSGGGIYIAGGNITVDEAKVIGNSALTSGGGVYVAEGGTFDMTGGAIGGTVTQGNTTGSGGYGGGLFMGGGTATLSNGSISGNKADGGYGGGVYMEGGSCTLSGGAQIGGANANYANSAKFGGGLYSAGGAITVQGGHIDHNNATAAGGGIYSNGPTATVIITKEGDAQSFLQYNTAVNGGGIYANRGSVEFTDGNVDYNYASNNGGGMYVNDEGTLFMKGNAIMSRNHVPEGKDGGGVYLRGTIVVGEQVSNPADLGVLLAEDNYAGDSYQYNDTANNRNNIYLPEPQNPEVLTSHRDVITVIYNGISESSKVGFSVPRNYVPVIYCENNNVPCTEAGYTDYSTSQRFLHKFSTGMELQHNLFDDTERYTAVHYVDKPGIFDPDHVYLYGFWTNIVTTNPVGTDTIGDIDTPEKLAYFITWVNGLNDRKLKGPRPNAYGNITADIDMSEFGWVPIGAVDTVNYANSPGFSGVLNGNGHTITGISSLLNGHHKAYGIVGQLKGGEIRDLYVKDAEYALEYVDGLVIGGLAGDVTGDAVIANSEVSCNIMATHPNTIMGGLIGRSGNDNTEPTIHSSIGIADMTGFEMGGLIGRNVKGNLYNSFANAKFTSQNNNDKYMGGLVAVNGGTVENCYSRLRGDVPSGNFGILVGNNEGEVNYCYAPAGMTNYKAAGDSLTGHGNYGLSELPYLYRHRDTQVSLADSDNGYVPAGDGVDKQMLIALNNWVNEMSTDDMAYTKWGRPWQESETNKPLNDDYPILKMPLTDAVAAEASDPYLYYSPIDTLLVKYTAADEAIWMYRNNTLVRGKNVGSAAKLYIAEDVALIHNDTINAYVGITLDNSAGVNGAHPQGGVSSVIGIATDSTDWHMISTSLSNAPIGIAYDDVQYEFSFGHPTGMPYYRFYPKDSDRHGYFPSHRFHTDYPDTDTSIEEGGANYYTEWDFYSYDEPHYHWINFKRNKRSHWHMDDPEHSWQINYENESQMIPGKGYFAATREETFLQCYGTLNYAGVDDTIVTQTSGVPRHGYNLLGNPYQAYLDFKAFVEANVDDYDAIWNNPSTASYTIINEDEQGYQTFAYQSSYNPDDAGRFIHPHQGFFVLLRDRDRAKAHFEPVMRNASDTVISQFRGQEHLDYPLVNLFVSEANGNTDMVTVELGRPDEGGAPVMQALRTGNGKIWCHYNDEDWAIAFTQPGITEVGIRFESVEDTEYTLRWNTYNGEFSYLHIIDNMTGADVDCLSESEYKFSSSTSDYKSRFRLVFGYTDIEENDIEATEINFAFMMGDEMVVNGEGVLQVFDMNGRLVTSRELHGVQSTVALPEVANGVYVLRLTEGKQSRVQKMVISK